MTIQGATLHDQLEAAYDSTVGAAEAQPAATAEPAAAEIKTEEAKPDTRSAEERTRDEAGRFVKQEAKPDATVEVTGKQTAKPAASVVAAQPDKLGVRRPDSWKKELWPIWEKLDAGQPLTRDERKAFLEYVPEREGQYVKGVSAYKAEAENAKELNEAIAPYQDILQETGMRPGEFVSAFAEAHRVLSRGEPQQKLQFFAKLIQDYNIPVHQMLTQGQDGKVYFNQQYFQQQQQPHGGTAPDVRKMTMDTINQMMAQKDLHDFVNAVDASGGKLHPHYDEVRQTMNGLLRSGLAPNLKAAYDAAIRLPQHSTIFDAMQVEQQRATEETKKREDAEKVARAKAAAVSPRSSTPTGSGAGAGKKGLRTALEDAYDVHVAGRI